ncbi:MAG: outer membrane lipoprotein carrier protein LolA [Candidatus Eremiobacteraeota bacterium]|nr:outer membrane lipoprotein carrier protein LolA [Candidatus Eremiobacteraeota bacterium]MBV8282053.1 outer membrane lipoprotein carrier protein LolA [Candidatus Eremiobacteraeota bacterium]
MRSRGARFISLASMLMLAGVFAPAAGPAAAAAAPDAYALLQSAVTADDHVSFSGSVTTLVYGGTSTSATVVRIEHKAPNDWRLWYVAPADAYGRLIISNESVAYEYEPTTGKVFSNDWASLSPFATTLDVGRIKRNYTIQVTEHAAVAGRSAHMLSLTSNYSHALVLRLWVDSPTGIILRRETYHGDGTIASKTEFDSIRFVKDLPDDLFKMTVPVGMTLSPGAEYGASTTAMDSLVGKLNFKPVGPRELADGFTFEKGSTADRGGVQTVQFVYSDGLRSLSLFENPTGRYPTFDDPAPKPMAVGKLDGKYVTSAGQTLLSWNDNGLNFTLVGDLPAKELAHIASAL